MSWARKSERESLADLLLKMAELHLRLFGVRESYELLQRASPMVSPARRVVLDGLLENCLMCECLKARSSMSGVEISPGNEAAELLGAFGKLLSDFEYNRERILSLTGAESLIDFSNDEGFSDSLATSNGDEGLVYLVRLFLLRMQVPLKDLFGLVGADCCKLLLELQVVTAVQSGRMLSIEEATADLTGDSTCFSNIRLWPLPSLIIATDAQTWPYQDGADRFEPVMYLSDDSLALLDAAPQVQGLNILDICCGSGVQGISALANNAASVTFSDLNPRAVCFVRFNLALNRLLSQSCDFALGDAYSALESKKFDGILANPPFLPAQPR